MTRLTMARDALEARLIIGMLAEHGIRAVSQGEALAGVAGAVGRQLEAAAPSIWVEFEADVARALELVEAARQRVNPTECDRCGYQLKGSTEPRCPECGWEFRVTESWTCPGCGEQIEGQFTECWNCGAARPAA